MSGRDCRWRRWRRRGTALGGASRRQRRRSGRIDAVLQEAPPFVRGHAYRTSRPLARGGRNGTSSMRLVSRGGGLSAPAYPTVSLSTSPVISGSGAGWSPSLSGGSRTAIEPAFDDASGRCGRAEYSDTPHATPRPLIPRRRHWPWWTDPQPGIEDASARVIRRLVGYRSEAPRDAPHRDAVRGAAPEPHDLSHRRGWTMACPLAVASDDHPP